MKTFNSKKLLSIVSVIAILMSLMTFAVSAASASDAKESVVAVIGADGGQGTGFAIGEVGKPIEYVVTNCHVVEGELGYTVATVAFDLASNDMVLANVYFYDEEKDIAVLKLPQPTTKRKAMVLCPMKYVDYDDAFAALGYPGNISTDWPQYSKNDITITKGGIKRDARISGQDTYILDIEITYGNSGGPLVNSKGEVVGINSFMLNEDNYAIAIDELLKVLTAEIETGKIAVTIHSGINWLLISGLAVLAIIIVLVIVLVARGGKKEPVAVAPSQAAPVTAASNVTTPGFVPTQELAAKLIAIGGTLNGKRFSFGEKVKIGRDPSKCAITYPVNTQGISAEHCEVSFNGSVCYVKDTNSSYGTFTIDGKKIAPNTAHPLKNGDRFYLASPENTFEVRF